MRIGTWNLRGLKLADKRQHLANDINTYKLDILTVQETHLKGTDQIELPTPNNNTNNRNNDRYTLYHTGSDNNSHHGVGIIIKNNTNAHFKRITDRICTLTVDLNEITNNNIKRKITIISAYAPTLTNSEKNPEVAENFYTNLENTINSIPNRNLLFIGADTNAQLGINNTNYIGNVGIFGKGDQNSNGERLGDFLSRNNLIATNTFFEHKLKHRTTWTHPNLCPTNKDSKTGKPRRNPYRNQIDFIITSKNLKTEITDSRSYHGTTLDSDHNLVICNSNIKLHRIYKQKVNKNKPINVENLKNPEKSKKYREDLENKLEAVTDWWEIVEEIKTTGEEALGIKPNTKSNNSTNNDIKKLSEERLKLKFEIQSSTNTTQAKEKSKKRNKLRTKIEKLKKKDLEKTTTENLGVIEIEAIKDDSRRTFAANRIVNRLVEKSTVVVEDGEGLGIINNPTKKVEAITSYFKNTFKQEKTEPPPRNNTPKIKKTHNY